MGSPAPKKKPPASKRQGKAPAAKEAAKPADEVDVDDQIDANAEEHVRWNSRMHLWIRQVGALIANEGARRDVEQAWIRLRMRSGDEIIVAAFLPLHPLGFLSIAQATKRESDMLTNAAGKRHSPIVRMIPFSDIADVHVGFDDPPQDHPVGFEGWEKQQPDAAETARLATPRKVKPAKKAAGRAKRD